MHKRSIYNKKSVKRIEPDPGTDCRPAPHRLAGGPHQLRVAPAHRSGPAQPVLVTVPIFSRRPLVRDVS